MSKFGSYIFQIRENYIKSSCYIIKCLSHYFFVADFSISESGENKYCAHINQCL